MNRLVDYFIILGFDDQKQAGTLGSGKVLQRFPENDWPDVPLIDGLELFCQPLGWRLSTTQQEPSFFVSVMTYMDANKHYCAFLSFYEPISLNSIKQSDEEDSELEVVLDQNASGSITDPSSHSSTMFAPKCIVLQSRHNFVEVFKNCLETIYTVHLECMDIPLEKLVGNLLCIEVPSPGCQLKFSIGANDKQLLTMPLSSTVPVTGTTVVQLFERLNVYNVISLFTAVMTDNKILFQSDSYSLLYESCHALTSLMYPFVYSHVYIPLLPSSLLEMLSSPTPFIMGVHSSLQDEVEDLLDVIVVDLDVGCISIPDCIHLPKLDGPAYTEMVYQLRSVITPQLMRKDVALRSCHLKPSPPHLLDKEIRAIFVRLFAQMLQGYRTCLQIVRINPKPFITFHKASFLGKRNLVENEFVVRLLESMFFNSFVQERGTPYRASDLFDELYATMHDTLKREMANPELVIKDIRELAHQLYQNEYPHPKDPNQIKIPLPTEGIFTRVHQPKFPTFKSEIIQEILDDDRIQREMLTVNKPKPKAESRIIAFGPAFCVPFNSDSVLFTNSARRLEVMRNCINCIFEEKIQDARKSFPAVLRALKNKSERLALAKELAAHVTGNKCVLTHEQFDLIVRLMNCALQQDCDYLDGSASGLRLKGLGDVNGLAAAILPLSMKYCRRLGVGGAGVLQFAYTCLQDHLIWDNMSFWESTFYQNVEQEVTSLYGSTKDTHLTALDIAAEQIRLKPKLNDQLIQQYASSEESTVYSQAVDYTHQIVSLKIPLDIGCHEKNTRSAKLNNSTVEGGHHSDTNSNFTGTGGGGGAGRESYRDDHEKETRDFDNESGFEEGSNGKGQAVVSEIGVNVIKFLGRFIDKVCSDGGVTEEHIKSLHSMIPDIVAIHCNTLDAIYKESKNIPPVTKPKIITPSLLPGEDLVMKSLRAYLIPDGRDEVLGSAVSGSSVTQIPQPIGGPVLLPAEGAIFLTNYRVIFRGRPCDQYAAENVIVRSFPIATLVKEKKVNISSKYLIETIDQCIQEGLQLRSNIFELMKIAFDEEVSSEDIETLRKMINKARTPPNVFHMFAFTSQIAMSHQLSLLNLQKQKEKSTTFKGMAKGMAKKTLMRTAQMAGLKTKSRKSKYLLPASGIYGSKTLTPGYNRQSMVDAVDDKSVSDDLSINSDSSHVHTTSTLPPLSSSSVTGSNVDVHLSPVNPKDLRTLKKLTELSYVKDYQRLGLGSVKDILSTNGGNNYIGVVSPSSSKSFKTTNLNNSTSSSSPNCDGFRISSVNSTYTVAGSYPAFLAVPLSVSDDSLQRLSRLYKFNRFPVIVWKHPTSKGLLLRASSFHGKSGTSDLPTSIGLKCIYIFGEKGLIKSIDHLSDMIEFVPIEYHEVRQVKQSFKKLMKACCPSSCLTDPEKSFIRQVEDSEWLNQLQTIMRISSAIIDLIDLQGSTVTLSLEDDLDLVPQIVSVAELCLDPYYRTFEGFRVLIEKEWLAFGHRFSHRSNHTAQTITSGFAPIFLQFLDIVHQIMRQFPLSFQFNEYYLRFIAYHYVSCRFRTFLLDSEAERAKYGWPLEDATRKYSDFGDDGYEYDIDDDVLSGSTNGTLTSNSVNGLDNKSTSFWDYAERIWNKSPIFFNFYYIPTSYLCPESSLCVLRPYCGISNLRIWDYYLMEQLNHGPSYDFEVVQYEKQRREEIEATEQNKDKSQRTIINASYDCTTHFQPNYFEEMLEKVKNMEMELGKSNGPQQKWHSIWDRMEIPVINSSNANKMINSNELVNRQGSIKSQILGRYARTVHHKKNTIDLKKFFSKRLKQKSNHPKLNNDIYLQ